MDLTKGTQIDGYEILESLGSGGQSVVYLAVDKRLRRQVAIKLISDSNLAEETGRRRFLLEAQTLSSLSHANIATIYSIGEYRGHPFIVMEYVQGLTLQDYVEKNRPDGRECLRLMIAIVEAIRYAHHKGFIHRDLKPSNIMVSADGQVKLLDFGLARITREAERQRLDSPTELTATGVVMGTVYYLSPEQALTNSATEKSDLFSLGVIMYEMITGKRPFDRNSALTTLYAIIHADPPPIDSPDPLLQSLKPPIMKLLEKQPERRYPSAEALLDALQAIYSGKALEKTISLAKTMRLDTAARPRKWMLAALAAVLTVLVIAGLWWRGSQGGQANRPQPGKDRQGILVLPIKSGPGEQDRHLAGVITSEIISSLNRTPSLRVLSIPSEFIAAEKNWSEKIVSRNQIGFTLSGDLSLGGQRLRLSAQIIDQRDYRVIWSRVFNEAIDRIFVIPSAIAAQLAYEAGVIFKADQLEFPGQKAFDLYTRADLLLSGYDPVDLPQSISLFRECMAEAPDFRPVYEKLGLALMQYRNVGIDYNPDYLDEAYTVIGKGREIRGDSVLLRTQEIWYHLYTYNFQRARILAESMRNDGLDPPGSKHLIWLSFYLGEVEQSVAMLEEAVRREPFDASYHLNRVVLNTMLGKRDRVEQAHAEAQEIFRTPMVVAIIDGWKKMSERNFQAAYDIFRQAGGNAQYHLLELACAEARFCLGDYESAATHLQAWLDRNPYAMEGWWLLCLCHELRGQTAERTATALQALKYADMLYQRFPDEFLKTAAAYFRVIAGQAGVADAQESEADSAADSLTRYLRKVIQIRLKKADPGTPVPVPYNPTYWMNRFCEQELRLLQDSQTGR